MLEAIRSATREILVEFYWIAPDAVGARFRAALVERARRGVRVRVLYDALGSRGMTEGFWSDLVAAGGEVHEYHAFLPFSGRFRLAHLAQRDHRKIVVVDGRVGFTGGVNLGREWLPASEGGAGWRDQMICARGPVAGELRSLFFRTWRRVTLGHVPPDVRPLARRKERPVYVLASQRRRRRSIRREYLARIGAARRTVDIANAYFLPDLRMRRALFGAVRRGVRVRVLVPESSDVPVLQFAVEAFFDTLLRHGVQLYALPPPMLHTKTAIVDSRFVTIGSYNLDERSLRKNLEANLGVVDDAFGAYATAAFEEDLALARPIDRRAWGKRSYTRVGVEWLALGLRELL
jgi:cardiolipin synthase